MCGARAWASDLWDGAALGGQQVRKRIAKDDSHARPVGHGASRGAVQTAEQPVSRKSSNAGEALSPVSYRYAILSGTTGVRVSQPSVYRALQERISPSTRSICRVPG